MSRISQFMKKLSLLSRRTKFRDELDEEMAFHQAESEREHLAAGMAPDDARYAAMRQLGNVTRLQQESREIVGFRAETVLQDVRFAMRQMRRNPGFAFTAILILALGMGVSIAIFGFVDAELLEPLPYSNAQRLMSVDEANALFRHSNISRADYEDWARLNRSFSSLDVYTGSGFLLRTPSGSVPVPAARVSDGFFSTLGVTPMLGRGFLPSEDQPGAPKIAILSHGIWMKQFSSRSDVIGQSVNLSGDTYTIVGVLPRDFAFAPRGNAEIWVPLLDKSQCESRRTCHNLDGIGRLRDGVTQQAALADLRGIAAQLERQYPGSNRDQTASVIPLSELIVGQTRPILLTLLAAACLLLLIACVNVASLLLVRAESRRREVAVRGALGATPVRLVRQFVTEGLLLAAAGCAVGLIFAGWLMALMTKLIPQAVAGYLPFLRLVGLNRNTCLFAAGIALLSAILMAVTPVLRLSFQEIRDGLADGGRTAAGGLWRRVGGQLVVIELAIAVVLLAGAGLLGQSFYRLLHIENGFDTTHLATVQVMALDKYFTKDEQLRALYGEIERRLSSSPGIVSVGITSTLPVQCNCNTDWIRIVGKPFHGEHNEVDERDVDPAYLSTTLKARLLRGRFFDKDDDAARPRVVVINQALAEKYFPGENPLGRKLAAGDLDSKSMREIVGVIANVREGALDDEVWPAEYEPISQNTDHSFAVVVRTENDEKAILPLLVGDLRSINPNLGVHDEITMTDQIESSETALLHRFSAWLVGGFAAMALLLGVVGLYGVVAYSVSQRTREIGVRMALGAQRSSVYKLVMREAGRLTIAGIGIGILCSIGASLLMRKLLFGVQAWDIPTLAVVALMLSAASLAASFLPARRAASLSPTDALRAE
ncbi:MAG: ABC transporter permease [Terracidiphilus sp.]